MSPSNDTPVELNWQSSDISTVEFLPPVNWEGLVQYASSKRAELDGTTSPLVGKLSSQFAKGGKNIVRSIDFEDGIRWIVRLPKDLGFLTAVEALRCEIDTMGLVRRQSAIPVPEVYAYELGKGNLAGVPFVLMEFVPGSTAMDAFGGHAAHKGQTLPQFKASFHATMADIQVQMSAIRFDKIGALTKSEDGTYVVGPIPGIGGPFDTAARFFDALTTMTGFPSRLKGVAKDFTFRDGPFPLFHPDFNKSNIIIDSQHRVLSVIDWEDAFVAPWEMVEFTRETFVARSAMDDPPHSHDEKTRQGFLERSRYIELAREAEDARGLDHGLSTALEDLNLQKFAFDVWMHLNLNVGFYGSIRQQKSELWQHKSSP